MGKQKFYQIFKYTLGYMSWLVMLGPILHKKN